MAATDPQSLFFEAQCYACIGAPTQMLLKLALERRILLSLNPGADVTPQGLLTYAACFGCFGAAAYELMELALLDQISQKI